MERAMAQELAGLVNTGFMSAAAPGNTELTSSPKTKAETATAEAAPGSPPAGSPAGTAAPPQWEVRQRDGTVRQVATAAELFPAILNGEIPGDLPCRRVPPPPKNGKAASAKWSRVSETIGKSSFEARLLFRPIWAHSLRGLEIGAALGFSAWMLMNVFNGLSAALELMGPQYNRQGHYIGVKFAAYGIVCAFWFFQGALPMLAASLPLPGLKSLSAWIASKALFATAACLFFLASSSGQMPAVFSGIMPGLGSAFGAMVAGCLAGGPPGMVIGTIAGLARTPGIRRAPGWPREAIFPLLLKGIVLPVLVSAAGVALWLRYSDELVRQVTQMFMR